MRPRPQARSLALAILITVHCSFARSQATAGTEEVRSMLRVVSKLVPQIDNDQRPNIAYNIAGQQMRIGDLSGALKTVQAVGGAERDRVWVLTNVASVLAWQGNASQAIQMIQSAAKTDMQGRAQAYVSIAQERALKGDFDGALRIVKLIEDGPAFPGESNLLLDALIRIQMKQWETGDRAGAETTLNKALDVVQTEQANSSTPEFAKVMPVQMYGALVGALAREGNRAEAYTVLERVYGLVADAGESPQKQDLLYALAAAQANLGEYQDALDTAHSMEDGDKRDSAIFLTSLERTQHGDLTGALDLALDLSVEFSRNTSLREIAGAQAASGNYVEALATIDRIEGAADRAYGLSQLALEEAQRKDPVAPLITQLAWEAALRAGTNTQPYVLGQIAVARGMTGDFAGALDIVGTMSDQDGWWAVESLTQMLVHADRKTDAIALAESQTAAYPKACAYLGIAMQLIDEQKKVSEAIQKDRS